MARRSHGFSRARGGARRSTGWEAGPGSLSGVDAAFSASTSIIIGTGVGPVVDGLTLIRTRGEMLVSLASVVATQDGFLFGLGIGIVTADAFAIGVTATPTPLEDADWDGWLWHTLTHVFAPTSTGVAEASDAVVVRVPIDSKAMRKVGINEVIYMVAESSETGTAVATVYGLSRILFKNP